MRSPRRGGVYVAAAVLFPLIPWLLVGSVGERFSGTWKSVAKLAAFYPEVS